MRPRLKPVLRRVERDGHTLQFGVHPHRAVVLTDLEPAVRRLIDSLDGTRTLEQAVAESDLDDAAAREVIALLAARGVIDDATVRPRPLASLTMAERERLRPDLDRLSLTSADGGMGALERRRAARVRIYGAGRVGAQVAVLLAASGVGHVCVVDPGEARPEDVVPGGLGYADVGAAREEGAVAAARVIAPSVNAWTGRTASRLSDGASRPDLVIIAPVGPLDSVLVHEIGTERIPHLLATAFEGCGSVGPLVIPGTTPCLHCLDLTRRDRDPSWPAVSARLGGYPVGEIACDTTLSSLVAAQTAGHTLTYLDGGDVTNGTLDLMPDWRWRHRSWERHPHCPCSRNDLTSLTMVT
ncbi:ThiF family adenylyltransferase [Planotetraspora sp. A-T 1434]|uniref:ThiF family adenylyltransferase n=1 Tax=Planotetraspora sp. A-T 1434 TaxID=2979219 RepID=UPI0021C10802|nr:ThiF family adenylyltransferase [Planotetraspora sp. A-T 1434]MCT9932533.1 ThiF family adenylyltransferase [Planotetraspora sp. A-T 1434]